MESRKVEVTLTTLVEKKVEKRDKVPEIIDSGPMCTTNVFQNKSVAYLTLNDAGFLVS